MQTLPNISASSIKTLKKCPMAWYLTYVQGIREVETADVLRIGSVWHKLMEYLQQTGSVDKGMEYLNEFYVGLPSDHETERIMLAYCYLGYVWRYQGDDFEVLETETRFEIPYNDSKVVGVMDMVFKTKEGRILAKEYKTSGRDIDLNGDYWPNLSMGVQARMYVWASRITGDAVDGIYYDVFRKPQIKPKLLSAADTKKFLADFTYQTVVFDVQVENVGPMTLVTVDGTKVDVKWNAKGTAFAIRESSDMFGARILANIYEDPDKYFMRKEVVVTEPELLEFERELAAIYVQMERLMDSAFVYKNEDACDTPYRCPMQAICYSRRNREVIDGGTPAGYKRIKLTFGETT